MPRDEITHGCARRTGKSSEYHIWVSMRQRCTNPRNKSYPRYGGRGIAVDGRWSVFANFLADMGPRPTTRHTLDRVDNDGPYSAQNCRWATFQEQANNTRRNIHVTVDGVTMNLGQAVAMLGLRYGTVLTRIRRGQTPEQALGVQSIRTYTDFKAQAA